jgi:hypothetical protein
MSDDNGTRQKTSMDDAFCARMRAAILAGWKMRRLV